MQGIQMLDKTAIKVEAFKRGIFDFISCNGGKRHEKQEEALRVLTDNETKSFFMVVLPGGAKIMDRALAPVSALAYPGTKRFYRS